MNKKISLLLFSAAAAACLACAALPAVAAYLPSISQGVQAGAGVGPDTNSDLTGQFPVVSRPEDLENADGPAVLVMPASRENPVYQSILSSPTTPELLNALGLAAEDHPEQPENYQVAGLYEIDCNSAAAEKLDDSGLMSITLKVPGVGPADEVMLLCTVDGKTARVRGLLAENGILRFAVPPGASVLVLKKL